MNYHNEDLREDSSELGMDLDMDLASVSSSWSGSNSGKETIYANPESEILSKDQNKLIHLDPIPDFKDKSEIKPWLQKIFYPQGIEIVIERSDNIKVVFKCKAARRGKNAREKGSIPPVDTSQASSSPSQKKKRSVSRFNTCTFRIRATFSLKRKKWNIVVLNNTHSHPLKFNPHSDEYKKFKAKLKEDGDWEAVKKFDELEYRTLSNLPIQTSLIPCDCGLTNEIKSFNIVLPSTRPSSSNLLPPLPNASFCGDSPIASTSTNTAQQVKKPKLKKARALQKKENLLKSTTTQNFLSTSKNQIHSNTPISGFLDDPTTLNPSSNQFLTLASSQNTVTDLNEIDFTNIFNKPLHHHHHHQNDNHDGKMHNKSRINFKGQQPLEAIPNDLNLDQSGSRSGSVLFSPMGNSSYLYLSPSDEVLMSPSNQRPASVTYQNSDSFFDFVGKQEPNPQYNESPNSLKERETFTESLCDLDQGHCYRDTSSQFNSVTTANFRNDAHLGDVLEKELSEIKMMNSEFKFCDEPHDQVQRQKENQFSQPILESQHLDREQLIKPSTQQDLLTDQLHEHHHDLYLRDFDLSWSASNPNLDVLPLPMERTAVKEEGNNNIRNGDDRPEPNSWDVNFEIS